MTEREMINKIDHQRRTINAMTKKISMLKYELELANTNAQSQSCRANFWIAKYADLHSQLIDLLDKYEKEALKHE